MENQLFEIKDVDEIVFVDYYNGWVPAEMDITKNYVLFEEDEIYKGNGRVKLILSEGQEIDHICIQYVDKGVRIRDHYHIDKLFAL